MIELRSLEKTYTATGHTALRDISLSIADGEIFGIIGLSGAGKSTLVRCINLLERPTKGQVLVDGQDLCTLTHKELLRVRRGIGMIFQNFNLLEQRTVLGNVLFPLEIAGTPKAEALTRAREMLALVGLADREKSCPSQLSGGQKQRVAIARALAARPRYLLCDEATSALDPNTTRSILRLLRQINREMGVTVIVITHEMRVISEICDRLAVIDDSRIAEVGTVAEVFSKPKSAIARELILPHTDASPDGRRRIRVMFRPGETEEPILTGLILDTKARIRVLYADTRETGDTVSGQMLLEVDGGPVMAEKVLAWLISHSADFEEVA